MYSTSSPPATISVPPRCGSALAEIRGAATPNAGTAVATSPTMARRTTLERFQREVVIISPLLTRKSSDTNERLLVIATVRDGAPASNRSGDRLRRHAPATPLRRFRHRRAVTGGGPRVGP